MKHIVNENIFKISDTRFTINGHELMRRRRELNITLERFAYACGWTLQYQWRLENAKVETVCDETRRKIEAALTLLSK